MLCECAWAAKLTKNTRLSRTYWKYVKRMGQKKATVAIANLILRIAYNMLKNQEIYREETIELDEVKESRKEKRLIKMLEENGYTVTKKPE